jgi:hypothetical protein
MLGNQQWVGRTSAKGDEPNCSRSWHPWSAQMTCVRPAEFFLTASLMWPPGIVPLQLIFAVYFVRMLIFLAFHCPKSPSADQDETTADHEFFDDQAHRPHRADERLCRFCTWLSFARVLSLGQRPRSLYYNFRLLQAVGRSVNVHGVTLARTRT